ncbi:MAG: hypothetical protein ACI8ZM_004747 [Crocinitomix sp.]|jgi:hypothetical protein
MAIDRIDWHSGGDFPDHLPAENGGTHIGFYLSWILNNDLQGELHRDSEDSKNRVIKVLNRVYSGRDFLISDCDEKFWFEDLNERGKSFTEHYYQDERIPNYLNDYSEIFESDAKSIYELEDSWENYEKVKSLIDNRYVNWLASKSKSKWWKFWKTPHNK